MWPMPLARGRCPKRAIGMAAIAAVLLSGFVNAPSIGVLGDLLNAQLLSQEIALTKAVGGGYCADPPSRTEAALTSVMPIALSSSR